MKRLRFDGMTEQSERDEIRRMRWRFKHKDSAARRRRYRPKAKKPDDQVAALVLLDGGDLDQ